MQGDKEPNTCSLGALFTLIVSNLNPRQSRLSRLGVSWMTNSSLPEEVALKPMTLRVCELLPPSQGIRRPCFACFFTKIYSKYIKNVGIKLASLKSIFQYKSNDTNFIQYNQVLVSLFIRSKFALDYACALFLKTEVVTRRRPTSQISCKNRYSRTWQAESTVCKTSSEMETSSKVSCLRSGKFREGLISLGNLQ
jgi:hypothetical protein